MVFEKMGADHAPPPPPQKKKIAQVGLQFLFKRLQSPREMKNKGYAIFFFGGGGGRNGRKQSV